MNEYHFFSLAYKQYNVSRETLEKLKIYKDLLFKWQKAINLVSRGTLNEFWHRHVLDSLQLIQYIRGNNILDIGSGGGFPGMVLAICSDAHVTCLDSDCKKMIFLQEVARLTSTSITLETKRVETFDKNNFDTICARGFANLLTLIALTKKHSPAGYGIFLKGAKYEQEIKQAQQYFNFQYEIFNSKTENSGKIVIINGNIHKKLNYHE